MLMISSSPPHSSSLWLPSDCSWKQTHNDITHTCRHADRPTLELWWPASTPAPHLTERWSEEPHYLWTELLTECALLFLDNETLIHGPWSQGSEMFTLTWCEEAKRFTDVQTWSDHINGKERMWMEVSKARETDRLTFSSWTAADGIKRWMNERHRVFFFLLNNSQRELHNTSNTT